MKDLMRSSKLRAILWIIGGIILLLVAFGLGTAVGYREASFHADLSGHYFENFYGAPFTPLPFGPLFVLRGPNPHGAIGKVVDVGTSTLSLVDPDGDETSVAVPTSTDIEKNGAAVSVGELNVGDVVAVIGAPNGAGQVVARFIRVLPAPAPAPASIY